ncbi:hypothetical protein DFJ58DRAFT_735758 [Suillus subalutaceus]|uniref:uncharacterized protein n=1 Tax=Suillus subalutaceus TaxID=48586 RepID=UPI001B87D4F7|nr:uncharacterized protein DFJ58DRAFT_735758 [Suillus subalutaceus]KAG1834668.1 hypothetical protein DFJ58DRAFT_735758 [Suillus subalutaceus]
MNPIPADWVLATTHLASDYVYHQFCALIRVRPKVLPPAELNSILFMACFNLVRMLADAYLNPVVLDKFGVIVLWYLPGAIDPAIQNDMMVATLMMSGPLGMSVTRSGADKKWYTHESNFQSSQQGLTPGCINLSPGWFLQAHPAPKFHPEVSATLRVCGSSLCQAMQRPAALIAAALRVMHPSLYWSSLTTKLGLSLWADNNQLEEMGNRLREWVSVFTALAVMCNRCSPLHHDTLSRAQWFNVMTSVGNHSPVRMQMPNIGVEIAYNSGVMVGASGRIVRHGMDKVDGD